MHTTQVHRFWLFLAAFFINGVLADSASSQTTPQLRYGFQDKQKIAYNVKIVADLPTAEKTHSGVLHYTVLSAAPNQFVLKSDGSLAEMSKSKPGTARSRPGMGPAGFGGPMGFGGPRGMRGGFGPPGFGPFSEPSKPAGTTFGRQGNIIIYGEKSSLPYFLGHQVDLVIESMPEENKKTWDVEREISITERDDSDEMPFGPQSTSETSRTAKEKISYAVLDRENGCLRISKKYSLKTAKEGEGFSHIDMAGSGEFLFDPKNGFIRSEKMKYDIQVNENNITVTIPMTLEFLLLSEKEVAEQEKQREEDRKQREQQIEQHRAKVEAALQEKKGRVFSKSTDPSKAKSLLEDLLTGDEWQVAEAARKIADIAPDDKNPDKYSMPLCAAFKRMNDTMSQAEIMAALEVWAGPDAEKTVIAGSKSNDHWVCTHAVKALGKFKTAAAADAAAAAISKARNEAESALKAMGPVAEPATIPLLKNSDIWIRATAANVLSEIGGSKAIKALAEESRLHPNEVREVDAAIVAITKRLAESKEDDDGDSEKKTKTQKKTPTTQKKTDTTEQKVETPEETKKDSGDLAAIRTWSDATGSYKIEASFIELKNEKVRLKKADGSTVSIALEKLSKADQEFVKKLAEAEDEKNPFE